MALLDPACENTIEIKTQAQDRGECSGRPGNDAGTSSSDPKPYDEQSNEENTALAVGQSAGKEDQEEEGGKGEQEQEQEEEAGEEEEEDDLQLAWSMLEIAKVIYNSDEAKYYMELSGELNGLFMTAATSISTSSSVFPFEATCVITAFPGFTSRHVEWFHVYVMLRML